jgi:hypothetical protein
MAIHTLKNITIVAEIVSIRQIDGDLIIVLVFEPLLVISVHREVHNKLLIVADSW